MLKSIIPLLALAKLALAGCETHTFGTCADGIVHWYDPNTGEICDPLDCGGGRAPPKTNVPGCAGYTGTEVRSTSYLSCFTKTATSLATATDAETSAETTTKAASKSTKSRASSTAAAASETAPATTSAPSTSTGTPSANSNAASSTSAPNAGNNLDGSYVAVAGAAIGALFFI